MQAEHSIRVPVSGGELHCGIWGDSGPTILACHGLTANHLSFLPLADALQGRCRLIAPDHRGRGNSASISGPWGMEEHARDVLAVLDHLRIERLDALLGHSMGAFIAAVAGAMAPQRIRRIVMVDGGLPLVDRIPEGMSLEQLVQSIVGPSMDRLETRFESRDEYLAFWRRHPSLADDWNDAMAATFDYDLVGQAPDLRSSVSKAAILGDVETQLAGPTIPDALQALKMPVRFVQAEAGIMDDKPLYSEAIIASWEPRIHDFSRTLIRDVNHYTILLAERGARAVANDMSALDGLFE